jgi:DNA invertase Pin-like site-specific DNA recombinase
LNEEKVVRTLKTCPAPSGAYFLRSCFGGDRHHEGGGEELRTGLDFLPEGDVLMVTRIDRLAAASKICTTSSASSGPAALR